MNSSGTKNIEVVTDSNFELRGYTNKHIVITPQGTGNVGIGTSSPSGSLHIKGKGATSATTNLLLQNSSGTDLLKVTDDGIINILHLNILFLILINWLIIYIMGVTNI